MLLCNDAGNFFHRYLWLILFFVTVFFTGCAATKKERIEKYDNGVIKYKLFELIGSINEPLSYREESYFSPDGKMFAWLKSKNSNELRLEDVKAEFILPKIADDIKSSFDSLEFSSCEIDKKDVVGQIKCDSRLLIKIYKSGQVAYFQLESFNSSIKYNFSHDGSSVNVSIVNGDNKTKASYLNGVKVYEYRTGGYGEESYTESKWSPNGTLIYLKRQLPFQFSTWYDNGKIKSEYVDNKECPTQVSYYPSGRVESKEFILKDAFSCSSSSSSSENLLYSAIQEAKERGVDKISLEWTESGEAKKTPLMDIYEGKKSTIRKVEVAKREKLIDEKKQVDSNIEKFRRDIKKRTDEIKIKAEKEAKNTIVVRSAEDLKRALSLNLACIGEWALGTSLAGSKTHVYGVRNFQGGTQFEAFHMGLAEKTWVWDFRIRDIVCKGK